MGFASLPNYTKMHPAQTSRASVRLLPLHGDIANSASYACYLETWIPRRPRLSKKFCYQNSVCLIEYLFFARGE